MCGRLFPLDLKPEDQGRRGARGPRTSLQRTTVISTGMSQAWTLAKANREGPCDSIGAGSPVKTSLDCHSESQIDRHPGHCVHPPRSVSLCLCIHQIENHARTRSIQFECLSVDHNTQYNAHSISARSSWPQCTVKLPLSVIGFHLS